MGVEARGRAAGLGELATRRLTVYPMYGTTRNVCCPMYMTGAGHVYAITSADTAPSRATSSTARVDTIVH